jgi:hypothetical protein
MSIGDDNAKAQQHTLFYRIYRWPGPGQRSAAGCAAQHRHVIVQIRIRRNSAATHGAA